MRTRMKGRCQLKLTTLGAAKVCFLEENGIARVCEAHFCSTFCGYTDLQTYQDGLNFLLEAGGNQHVILQYLRIPIGYNGGAVSQDQYHQTTGGNRDIL